jgi:hypothetical protein
MTHHDQEQGSDAGKGVEMEKWILRVLLLATAALSAVAIAASLDDIKRYARMRRM